MPTNTEYKERQRRFLMVALAGAEFERVAPSRKRLGEYARRRWLVRVLTANGTTLATVFPTRYEAVDWAIAWLGLRDTIT